MNYAELLCFSNYSFLFGASHPYELVARAKELGYTAIALTDECSLAGIAKAHIAAKECGIKLLVGSQFALSNGCQIVVLAPNMTAYRELSGFITLARRRADKGDYAAHFDDLRFRLQHCYVIWLPQSDQLESLWLTELLKAFRQRMWLGLTRQLQAGEQSFQSPFVQWAAVHNIPIVGCGAVRMHVKQRKSLLDVLTAIACNQPIQTLGTRLAGNAECYMKNIAQLYELFPSEWLHNTVLLADSCELDLGELRYQYPEEVVPKATTPSQHLRQLVLLGATARWPEGVPGDIAQLIEKELSLIQELRYEHYFLTVYDVVLFARQKGILCQGRGSAANSVVCYCLHITEVSPEKINVLFERFISQERDEPPDIDVDFEHERREEVIQYIYQKYGRERAALAATVITYRSKSAIRDVGKALQFDSGLIEFLTQSLAWWDRSSELSKRIEQAGYQCSNRMMGLFYQLVEEIRGFPRHLSQHVGGFIISQGRVSDIVPLENAAMPERTIIQWDKEDLEAMGLLKIDVLALGMLSAIRKALEYVQQYDPVVRCMADIPAEDPATYEMLCQGDSIGVFQVESRAQMSMLPRLKPRCYYDLVIQIAIVRPGPVQGNMVHPFLQRRAGLEPVSYPNEEIKGVLARTMGVPIFQEQVISLAMIAAGFSGGEADRLRRAMASCGKNGKLLQFQDKFLDGMLRNGYTLEFAERLFEQVKGFGGYGFPESHSASFALLAYVSAWLKCHHPEAFICALLNSLPMGFYSASQLIQDAKRHGLQIEPVCINSSFWDNYLEICDDGTKAIRLGFRRVSGLSQSVAENIVLQRKKQPFVSIYDCAQRVPLGREELECLTAADAFKLLGDSRQQGRWSVAAIDHVSDVLPQTEVDELYLDPFDQRKEMLEDYRAIGLSLRAHPLQFLREQKPFAKCCRSRELLTRRHGSFVRLAGLVTGRQRPGTAKGTVFLTLEDETGNANVVVWPATQTHYRQALLAASLLVVEGRLEVANGVAHIIAGRLIDHSQMLQELLVKSRDFH